MMNIVMIARSTLYTAPGGDTVQAVQTCRYLNELGIKAVIKLTNEHIDYTQYNLLHFFNIIRPADIMYHIKKSAKPYIVSTILVDYSEYDKQHRKGVGAMFSFLPGDSIEYLKTLVRWILGRDELKSLAYLWKGQRKSIIEILQNAAIILPNSQSEYGRLLRAYACPVKYSVVPNGIDPAMFTNSSVDKKNNNLVLCVARIEGIKNQLNLIKALNNTHFRVLLIGNHSPNQAAYYRECVSIAAQNISFIDHLPQHELVAYYQQAKVHILPSWFETTGLSSIEAAAMGCNIVITDKGDTREYFGSNAFYCDPAKPESLLAAVEQASQAPYNNRLKNKILEKYTWAQAASQTLKAYQTAIA